MLLIVDIHCFKSLTLCHTRFFTFGGL